MNLLTRVKQIAILTTIIILSGCATAYHPINPPSLRNYDSHSSQDNIEFSYKYDVLRENGNRKYAKKEDLTDIKLIAIKITNNTDSIINLSKNISFYSNQDIIIPINPSVITHSIKQGVPGYLFYLLLSFVNLQVRNGYNVSIYPIGLIIGPATTLINMLTASGANKKMSDELYKYNILNKDIKKGETVYGLIGFQNLGYKSISIKKNNK